MIKENNSQNREKKIDSFINNLSTQNWVIILLPSLIGFIFFNIWLGILFEETGYPVPLLTSQLRFNASKLKSDFSVLLDSGTLNDYKLIQYLDVGIIISTTIFFGALTLFSIRRFNTNSYWRKKG